MYEHLTFFAQAKSEGRTWLEWKARTFSGIELAGVTVLEINGEGEITSIGIHHRPLNLAEGPKARSTRATSTSYPNKSYRQIS